MKLDLGNNGDLGGPVPPAFARWTSLQDMTFSYSRVETSWEVIQQMTSLRHLDLAHTAIEGPLPPSVLSSLTSLGSLLLSNAKLNGTLPDEIGLLSQLTWLQLRNSGLTGPIPVTLGNLHLLTKLEFAGTQLSGPIPPEFSGLYALNSLDLYNTNLGGNLPECLGHLPFLAYMDISFNLFDGPIPDSFCHPWWISFVASNNQLSELPNCSWRGPLQSTFLAPHNLFTEVPQLFFNSNFSQLDLRNNLLTCDGFSWFGAASSLFSLKLDNNPLACPLERLIEMLALKTHLSTLSVSNCSLQPRILDRPFIVPPNWMMIDFSRNPDLRNRFELNVASAMTVMNLSSTGIEISVDAQAGKSLFVLDVSSSVRYSCLLGVFELPQLKTIYRTNFSWDCADPVQDDVSVNYFKQEELFCPQRRLPNGGLFVTDSNFANRRGCYCQPNNWWNGTACVSSTQDPQVFQCDTHVHNPNHNITASFYPWLEGSKAKTQDFPRALFIQCDGVSDCIMKDFNSSCSEGREGFLCSKCSVNYALVGRQCVECAFFYTYLAPVILVLLTVGMVSFLYFRSAPNSNLLSITVFAIQMLTVLDRFSAMEDRAPPPTWIDSWRETLSFRPWSFECISSKFDFIFFISLHLSFPLAFAAVWFPLCLLALPFMRWFSSRRFCACICKCFAALYYSIHRYCCCCCRRRSRDDEQEVHDRMYEPIGDNNNREDSEGRISRDKMWSVFFNILSLGYTPLCQSSLSLFNCVEVPGLRYLSAAPYLSCDTPDVTTLSICCGFGIMVYLVGIPVLFLWLIGNDANTIKFLTDSIRDRSLRYWPLFMMFRQVLVLLVLSQLPLHSGLIPICVFVILVSSWAVHIRCQPYRIPFDNHAETALSLLVMILFFVRIFQGSRSDSFNFADDLPLILHGLQYFTNGLAALLVAYALIPRSWLCCSKCPACFSPASEEERNDNNNNVNHANNNRNGIENNANENNVNTENKDSDAKERRQSRASLNS